LYVPLPSLARVAAVPIGGVMVIAKAPRELKRNGLPGSATGAPEAVWSNCSSFCRVIYVLFPPPPPALRGADAVTNAANARINFGAWLMEIALVEIRDKAVGRKKAAQATAPIGRLPEI
jgi:hypothetical protein